MMFNAAYSPVYQKYITEALRCGIPFLSPQSIFKSNVFCYSKLNPTGGKQKTKNVNEESKNNIKDAKARKTYVMQNFTQESKSDGGNGNDGVHQTRVTLNAGIVYEFMQRRKVLELTPKTNTDFIQRKHWVLETQSPTYNLDLMYKRAEKGRNSKVLENIKLTYLKRMENIQNLMNKPDKKRALTQKMCGRNTSLISKAKSFHSYAPSYKKRDEDAQEPQQTKSHTEDSDVLGRQAPEAAAAKPETAHAEPEVGIPSRLSVDHQPRGSREELEVASKPSSHPAVEIAQHCSHRVTHMIRHVDADTKEKALVKKTEEIFDLQDVEGIMPVHIESVERPLVVGQSPINTQAKSVKIKEFRRRGKLHPESLEYMWIKVLLPKISKHIQYLEEHHEETRIVSNNVTVNSLDFIKKDPRTKFSGFPKEPGTKNIDVQD